MTVRICDDTSCVEAVADMTLVSRVMTTEAGVPVTALASAVITTFIGTRTRLGFGIELTNSAVNLSVKRVNCTSVCFVG